MKNLNLIFGICLLLLLNACQKNSVNPQFEKNIIGTWNFNKVSLTRSFSLGQQDQTQNFAGITLSFNPNHTVVYTNTNTGQTQTGNWVLEKVINSNQNINNCSFLLDININPILNITGTNLNVTNSKIKFNEGKAEGTFYYTLKKV